MLCSIFQTYDRRPKIDVGPINKKPDPDNINPMIIIHLGLYIQGMLYSCTLIIVI